MPPRLQRNRAPFARTLPDYLRVEYGALRGALLTELEADCDENRSSPPAQCSSGPTAFWPGAGPTR
jgi:hypothetical protein